MPRVREGVTVFCGPPAAAVERPHRWVLDADGNAQPEPNLLAWARWYETADRQLARDVELVGGEEVTVSTVFLALDHAVEGPPILWETMVFGGPLDGERRRYTGREDALQGHGKMVAWVITTNQETEHD